VAIVDNELSIYGDDAFASMDVGHLMRLGHPDVADGDEHIVGVVERFLAGRTDRAVVLDIGAGSGDLTSLLARRLDHLDVVAVEPAPGPAGQAARKTAGLGNAAVFDRPFEEWHQPVDVAVSWGSHHHLAHDYLHHAASLLGSDGLLVVGDEFCPEHLTPTDRDRLARAEHLEIVDGIVFDDRGEAEAARAGRPPPAWNARLESDRRRALWTWYRFVCDYAAERGQWDVVIAELAIARNDLVTAYGGEHKTTPLLLERELALAGFEIVERVVIGDREPELRSFVVYTCRLAPAQDGAR
jgi:SAM-dependent methyltransferase